MLIFVAKSDTYKICNWMITGQWTQRLTTWVNTCFESDSKVSKIILFALCCRLLWFFTPGYKGDFDAFEVWAEKMVRYGITAAYQFQDLHYECDYPPLYLIVLSFFGKIFHLFAIPIDSLAFDNVLRLFNLLVEFLFIRWIHRSFRNNLLTMIFLFNPVIILNAYAWGQVDVILFAMITAGLYEAYHWRWNAAALWLGLSLGFKSQAILYLPVFALIFLSWKGDWAAKLKGFCLLLLMVIIPHLPFLLSSETPYASLQATFAPAGRYPFVSLNAFNTWWAVFADARSKFPPGDTLVAGAISRSMLALVISAVLFMSIFLVFVKKLRNLNGLWSLCALYTFTFFMFLPEMHERYLFAFFVFSPFLLLSYHTEWKYFITLSIIQCINLAWSAGFNELWQSYGMLELSIICSWISFIVWLSYFYETIKRRYTAEPYA